MDRKKLAIVHIVKKELNLSDKEYRSILQQAAGVSSAPDQSLWPDHKTEALYQVSLSTTGLDRGTPEQFYPQILS